MSYSDTVTSVKHTEMDELAYFATILNLSDFVIWKVGKHESAKSLWDKLDELYIKISLPNKLFLVKKISVLNWISIRILIRILKVLLSFFFKPIFTKLFQDIKLIGYKTIDAYSPIILLNAITDSYSDSKTAIKYRRHNISLDIVVNGLKSKEHDMKVNSGKFRNVSVGQGPKLFSNEASSSQTNHIDAKRKHK